MVISPKFEPHWVHTSPVDMDGQLLVINHFRGYQDKPIMLTYAEVQNYIRDMNGLDKIHKWVVDQADVYELMAYFIRFSQDVERGFYLAKGKR